MGVHKTCLHLTYLNQILPWVSNSYFCFGYVLIGSNFDIFGKIVSAHDQHTMTRFSLFTMSLSSCHLFFNLPYMRVNNNTCFFTFRLQTLETIIPLTIASNKGITQ